MRRAATRVQWFDLLALESPARFSINIATVAGRQLILCDQRIVGADRINDLHYTGVNLFNVVSGQRDFENNIRLNSHNAQGQFLLANFSAIPGEPALSKCAEIAMRMRLALNADVLRMIDRHFERR